MRTNPRRIVWCDVFYLADFIFIYFTKAKWTFSYNGTLAPDRVCVWVYERRSFDANIIKTIRMELVSRAHITREYLLCGKVEHVRFMAKTQMMNTNQGHF